MYTADTTFGHVSLESFLELNKWITNRQLTINKAVADEAAGNLLNPAAQIAYGQL